MSAPNLMARFREGQQFARQRRYAEAEQAFRDCLDMRPNDLPARNQLAMVLSRTGRMAEAEKELEQSIAQDPNNLPSLSQMADLYERTGRQAEAEALYRKCLALRPEDVPSALRLGKLLMERGKTGEAEEIFLRALLRNPGKREVPLLCQLGINYTRQNRPDAARAQFEECLRIDQENIPARHQLGILLAKQGNDSEAENLFQECIWLDSRQYQAYHQLGMLYTRQGRYEEAERMLQNCLRIDPKLPAAYQHLGVLYTKQGRRREAEEMFRKTMERGASPEAAQSLAVFQAEEGNGEAAERLLNRMPKGDARNRTRLMCANALQKAGKPAEAQPFLTAILAEEPENIPALHLSGSILLQKGDHPGAAKCFSRILKAEPENAAALHSLAELHFEEGEPEKGIALLERITESGHYAGEKLGWIKGESYDPTLVWREINRHMRDDTTRPRHGVFHMNAMEIDQAIAQCMVTGRYECRGMTRRYTYPWPDAGHAGGRDGDGHTYHAITVITYWDGERIINAYPSDPPA